LPTATLDAKVTRSDVGGKSLLTIALHNPGSQIALMAHLQLRRKSSGERVLPVYYSDNYVSLLPNETRTITIEVATSDLKGEEALVLVDGWNVGFNASSSSGVGIAINAEAQVNHWPVTGLPMIPVN
jgi:Exo-beta-D-glucosaminidase Ig-fold domain